MRNLQSKIQLDVLLLVHKIIIIQFNWNNKFFLKKKKWKIGKKNKKKIKASPIIKAQYKSPRRQPKINFLLTRIKYPIYAWIPFHLNLPPQPKRWWYFNGGRPYGEFWRLNLYVHSFSTSATSIRRNFTAILRKFSRR